MHFIADLREGDSVRDIYLCKKKQELRTKAGKSYDSLTLQDKTGTLDAKIWDPGNAGIGDFDNLDYVEVTGDITSFQGSLQLNVKRVRRAAEGEYDPKDYLPVSDRSIDEMWADFIRYIDKIEEPHMKALLQAFFLEDTGFAAAFRGSSAAKTMHHGFVGGLLEHSLNVTKLCYAYCSLYPTLKKDLLVPAAMLLHTLCLIPAVLSRSLAGTLVSGFLVNLCCGYIAGYYLFVLTRRVAAAMRAATLGAGYGLSRLQACGRKGEARPLLMLLIPRKRTKQVIGILRSVDSRVMVSTLTAASLMGGVLPETQK